jgi:5-methylthioadenosine/S-adenosylhomocysteine deaminase
LNSPHLIPIHDVFAQLVFAAGRSDVNDVFVDGVGVVRNRRSTRLDFEKLRAEVIDRISNLK